MMYNCIIYDNKSRSSIYLNFKYLNFNYLHKFIASHRQKESEINNKSFTTYLYR